MVKVWIVYDLLKYNIQDKMSSNFSVLIPDGESPFAFHVLACLHQAGEIDVHLLSRTADAMSRYSSAKKSFHVLPDDCDYLECIGKLCAQLRVDLIMPVGLAAILYFAEQREVAEKLANLSLLDVPGNLQLVSDKGLLANFLRENYLPHPRSITNLECFDKIIHEFPMPVLIKPRIAGDGEGILKFTDRTDIIRLVGTQTNFFDEYLIQEYVDGYDIDCSVLCRDGVILAYTIQKTLYANRESYKPAEVIEFVHDAQVLDVATRLMKTLKWTGIAHIDMRCRSSNSQVEIIEINPRFWGSIQGSLNVGVNFPSLMCLAAKGHAFPVPPYAEAKYMSGFSAIKRMWKNQPVTHLSNETNLLTIARDPLPNFMKLIGHAN